MPVLIHDGYFNGQPIAVVSLCRIGIVYTVVPIQEHPYFTRTMEVNFIIVHCPGQK